MASALPATKTGKDGASAIPTMLAAPSQQRRAAARAAAHPDRATAMTSQGVIRSPMLPPPATTALAMAPA